MRACNWCQKILDFCAPSRLDRALWGTVAFCAGFWIVTYLAPG